MSIACLGSLSGPREEGDTTLIPDVAGHALGRDIDRRDKVCPLIVEVDGDFDRLVLAFLSDRTGVDPLNVDER